MAQVRWVAGLALALATAGIVSPAGAQTRARAPAASESEGRVIEVQDGDLILDVGTATGLREGQTVQLWRPVIVRHPVTKRTLRDRFLIGELELVQVRPALTLARPSGEVARAPAAGDVVLWASAASPQAAPDAAPAGESQAPAASPAQGPVAPQDPHAAAIAALMHRLRGRHPETRAAAYEDLARRAPSSPYAQALLDEAAALRSGAGEREPYAPIAETTPTIDEVRAGEEVRVALEISSARGAVLHVRSAGEPSFTTLPMASASGDYFGVTIPAAEVQGSRIELFVEAVDARGRSHPVLGGAGDPWQIDVRARPSTPPPDESIATIRLSTDFADYNRLRGDDYAWQTEGELGLRLRDEGVRAVRSGFGVYRGEGGSVEELDERGLEPRAVGLTYGYLEGELAPSHGFAILPRGVVGLGDDGITAGGQLLLRIGNDRETNLLLGGEALGSVGVRGIAQVELAVFERFPILLRTEVTNQPAGASPSSDDLEPGESPSMEGSDVGARGIAEVGYRVVDQLVVRVRGSFQGRTIQHAGPGLGGGVSYSW